MKSETSKTNRIAWITILQAIAIAAIVAGHVDLAGDMNTEYVTASWIDSFSQFSLPVFFFISGYLYVRSSLSKKSYKDLLNAKVLRLLVPFLFITIVMYLFKLQLPQSVMSNKVELSADYIINMLFVPWNGPARHMWYLESLFTFFALMPLYKWTLKENKPISAILMLIVAWAIQLIAGRFIHTALPLAFDRSMTYFLFFYLGMVIMKYNLTSYLQNVYALLISAAIYVLGTFVSIPLQGVWGIIMIVSVSYYISLHWENVFSSFSKYSYQIYLMHIPPIMVGRMIYHKQIIASDTIWFAACWLLTLLMGIYLPVIICKVFEKLPAKARLLIGM